MEAEIVPPAVISFLGEVLTDRCQEAEYAGGDEIDFERKLNLFHRSLLCDDFWAPRPLSRHTVDSEDITGLKWRSVAEKL